MPNPTYIVSWMYNGKVYTCSYGDITAAMNKYHSLDEDSNRAITTAK